MFISKKESKFILLCGNNNYEKSFMFEATLHCAEKGNRVFYITPEPLKSFPATYHDRNISPAIFNMIKFLYLANYEALIEQLYDLHTFATPPSTIIIDNLDLYISDDKIKEQKEVHIAKLCAFLQDVCNTCARVKKTPVHLCTSLNINFNVNTSLGGSLFQFYNQIWILNDKKGNNEVIIDLHNASKGCLTNSDTVKTNEVFQYRVFNDNTLILDKIFEIST